MNVRRLVAGGIFLFLSAATFGKALCDIGDDAIRKLQPQAAIGLITKQYQAGEYGCAIHATSIQAELRASIPGRDGIDDRFALREMALVLLNDKSHPSTVRLELLKAATGTLHNSNPNIPKEELQANVRILFAGAKQFLRQDGYSSWLDALEVAIVLDRHLPDADRSIQSWEIDSTLDAARQGEWAKLVKLAKATRGDKVLNGFRSELAGSVYYHASAWKDGDTREKIIERCHDLLRLAELLNDTPMGYQCNQGKPWETWQHAGDGCSQNWQWMLVMRVGVAYHRLGMKAEANSTVKEALRIMRNIKEPDYRLAQFQYALADLARANYDRSTVMSVLADMRKLANSLDTQLAKEVRASLSNGYRNWELNLPAE